jgi:Neurotransmitter-gated ion-channel ligand binding domain
LLIAGLVFSTASTAAEKSQTDLRRRPFRGKTPVEVSVGLYLTDLVAIDESRETFEVTGYLFAKWRDARLQRPADAQGDNTTRPLKVEEIWSPPIESEN